MNKYLEETFLPSLYEVKKNHINYLSKKQFDFLKHYFKCECNSRTIKIYTHTHKNYKLRLLCKNNKRWLEWKFIW